MLRSLFLLAATIATPALAGDIPGPAGPIALSGGATIVSDYRFRGISQTDRRVAVQGYVTLTHESGFYASVWGSTIHGYAANGSGQEIDLIAGYRKMIAGTAFDVGGTYYYYPGSHGAAAGYVEPYASVSHIFGPASIKAGLAYAPGQRAIATPAQARGDVLYTYGELSGAIPGTGFSVLGHLGYSHGRSTLTNGLAGYADWSLGARYGWKSLTFGLSYVDTDMGKNDFTLANGHHPAGAGAVLSLGASF